jgi:hypothetical protein
MAVEVEWDLIRLRAALASNLRSALKILKKKE